MPPSQFGPDVAVCAECIDDKGIKAFIESAAAYEECSFCGAESDEAIAASLDEVVRYMEERLDEEYDDPANYGGNYISETYDTQDVMFQAGLELPNDNDRRLFNAICARFDKTLWCDPHPYGLSPQGQLIYSWEEFCKLVKHERRFFFADRTKDRELFSAAELLDLIFEYADQIGIIRPLPQATRLFRVRKGPARGRTALDLGPPPPERATQNRMSPAGISMMYASEDPETAVRETVDDVGRFTMATFLTEREALIVDFAGLPRIPSIFETIPDSLEYNPRRLLIFLHALARDISRPIERDNRVHIEYVPTQVVTEYLRTKSTIAGRRIEGVRYSSSRHQGGSSLVLFANQSNVMRASGNPDEQFVGVGDRWLRLDNLADHDVTEESERLGIPQETSSFLGVSLPPGMTGSGVL